jgi:hypothetical protein
VNSIIIEVISPIRGKMNLILSSFPSALFHFPFPRKNKD